MKTSSFLAAATFAITAFAWSSDDCSHDNALRCLIRSSAVATPFCQSYISVHVSTLTTTTVTPIATITLSITLTSTETDDATATTTTTTTTIAPVAKRTANAFGRAIGLDVVARYNSPSPTPKCLTATSYPASRVSSACSCLSVFASAGTITATAPTSTATMYISKTTSTTTTSTTVESDTATSTCYAQAVQNPGFERNANGSPWIVEITGDISIAGVDSHEPHTGTNSFHMSGVGIFVVSLRQEVALCLGHTYTFSMYFFAVGAVSGTINVVTLGQALLITQISVLNTWTQYTGTLLLPQASDFFLITVAWFAPGGGDLYIDDVTLTMNP